MPKPLRLIALAIVMTLTIAACGGDDDGGDGDGDTGAQEGATVTFGTSADPVVLDGALVSDGESLRAIDQMFEGLVTLEPGGTEVAPNLATDWETSEDGTEWTFNLRDDVTFHDGEPFNADAVCFNFDRWFNFTGSFQNPAATYYWQTVFGGFKNTDPDSGAPTESNFKSCTVDDEFTVTIALNTPSSSFLAAMALTNFTFASPAALEQYDADEGRVNAEGIFRATGTYGTEHPTGTGPFMFKEWVRNDHLTMVRNPDYWGDDEGNIETLIFRPIADNAARLQALQTGEIQGYDLVEPQDFETISGDENLQLLERPAFNVGYVGMNQAQEPLDDIEVRKAIAHAINREEVVEAFYAGQGVVAKEFMPPEVFGYADDVTEYPYDPDMAKKLLTDAGYELPVEVSFAYPTDVSRPYMPVPQDNFEAMVADLEDCCFNVKEQSAVWSPDYLDNVDNGRYGLYLLGWTGDFGDPDNFVGTFFQSKQRAWGFDNQEIFDCLDAAETETDHDARVTKYEECNRLIMDFLPGLPYVHTKPALAFTANVTGYIPSPVSLEPFSIVTVE
ncbi:MAG: ABC transporter substrate-binding protein [Actinomycetota bacterium]|nr:ABC transporter substrate-binding protein [Actinomycetota bacterium]